MTPTKRFLPALFLFIFSFFIVNAQDLSVKSPDGRIDMKIKLSTHISWSVVLNNDLVIDKAIISMDMGNGRVLGLKPKLRSKKTKSVNESLTIQIPNKDASVQNNYNELSLEFRGGYQLLFRAFNDGVAYQFIDKSSRTTQVTNEQMSLTFPEGTSSFFPQEESMYTHNEREYLKKE